MTMYPILFKLGPVSIFTYGFFLALAFLCGIGMAGREAKRLGVRVEQIYDLCFWIVLAALIGSRLLHILMAPSYFLAHPLEIFKLWKGGLAFQGGVFLAVIVSIVYMRQHQMPILGTFDILAVGAPLGQSIGRIGCFMAGCCYGRPGDLPWCVTFTHPATLAPQGIPIHPTQLYESLLALGNFGIILWLRQRKSFDGQLTGAYLALAGLIRFGVEFFRGDYRGPVLMAKMPLTQVIALVLAVGVGGWLLWRSWQVHSEKRDSLHTPKP
ncbi:MAG: prolipoprotein diacylglyceryl transferase [Deltaproteobacteria bacterium]|nr:prolipoprotein diacylglyceryl transferase [Deltaproteobacteria bacterium]MBW2134765.1 prolipoprotein diacylglyceryl transferase [Deltaproteobacteria bacterium]